MERVVSLSSCGERQNGWLKRRRRRRGRRRRRRSKAAYFRVCADASLFSSYSDVSVFLCPELSSPLTGQPAHMAPKGSNKQQSEEDLLLQDFSRNLSAKSTALFYGNALIVSAIPICEYPTGAASRC